MDERAKWEFEFMVLLSQRGIAISDQEARIQHALRGHMTPAAAAEDYHKKVVLKQRD